MTRTQTDRIVAFIRANPGCSILDLARGLDPFVANPRARISDARAEGHVITCKRDAKGIARYYVVEPSEQLAIGLSA